MASMPDSRFWILLFTFCLLVLPPCLMAAETALPGRPAESASPGQVRSASIPSHLPGRADVRLFPAVLEDKPDIPSPYRSDDGLVAMTVRTDEDKYMVIPVTVVPGVTTVPWEHVLEVDAEDFPTLARTGFHSEIELDMTRTITGRSIAEITEVGRPGRLSSDGFMSEDEDVLSVIRGDNRLVKALGMTHPEMARPLLQICNLIREGYQRRPGHEHAFTFYYNGRTIDAEVMLTKGGQESIFDDGLDGSWTIELRRTLDDDERAFLERAYARLDRTERDALIEKLTHLCSGEMQPFYIYRYGFYEGHTNWRTDPVAIAFMFGLKTLEEIEAAFPGRLDKVLTQHFAR
jgi:hypothetical protein